MNVYADKTTSKYLVNSFNYCFKNSYGYPAIFNLNKLKNKHVIKKNNKKLIIESIKVEHGKINSIMYKINNTCAYVSDVSKIYTKDLIKLKKLKFFIVDCLRYDPHPSHFNLKNIFEIVDIIKPKKTILTNMNNEIDYKEVQKLLPKNIMPAFDGMSFLI